MIHPLLALLATRPQLLTDHAEAYAELATAELTLLTTNWRQQALWTAGLMCSAVVAVALAGVSLMLWAVSPEANIRAPWALWLAPLLPLLLALICGVAARPSNERAFNLLRQQAHTDLQMLREAGRR